MARQLPGCAFSLSLYGIHIVQCITATVLSRISNANLFATRPLAKYGVYPLDVANSVIINDTTVTQFMATSHFLVTMHFRIKSRDRVER